MCAANTYHFRPLGTSDSIRLFRLEQCATRDADLRGELVELNPSSNPQYEALSYVWGKDEFPHTLHLEDGCLAITENLNAALRRLRRPDQSRVLWIDAVCIDQSNLVEKGPQVENMANIYKNASQVVAWLTGDSAVEIDETAILDLSRLAQEVGLTASSENLRDVLRAWLYGIKERGDQAMHAIQKAGDAGFSYLYESTWFTRMWIVQEAVLAAKLVLLYGDKTLQWLDFEQTALLIKAVNLTFRMPIPSPSSFRNAWSIIEARHYWAGTHPKSSREVSDMSDMPFYVQLLNKRDCKDARDRIFALRGLLSGRARQTIRPDYTTNVNTVYTEFARALLGQGHVGILYQAGLWKRKPSPRRTWPNYLPTWVPDYRKETTIGIAETQFGSSFGRDPHVELALDLTLEPFRLGTKATLIDVVISVQPADFLYDVDLRADHIALFIRMRDFTLKLCEKVCTVFQARHFQYPTGEDCITALACTLVGGGSDSEYLAAFVNRDEGPLTPRALWDIYKMSCLESDGEVFQRLKQEALNRMQEIGSSQQDLVRGIGLDFYNDMSIQGGIAWEYFNYLVKVLSSHWIFMTNDGFIGLGPLQTQADLCHSAAFIDGANVPLVLRDLGDDTTDWEVVGPCYLHGVMDGEAVRRNDAYAQGRGTIHLV